MSEKMRPPRPQYSFGERTTAAPCRVSIALTPEDQHAYAATQVVLRRLDSGIDDIAIRVDDFAIRTGARASGHQRHTESGAERGNTRDILRRRAGLYRPGPASGLSWRRSRWL